MRMYMYLIRTLLQTPSHFLWDHNYLGTKLKLQDTVTRPI